MDDVEFLWSCVREGKLSKESALELLDKCNKTFNDGRGDAAQGGHHTSFGCGKDTVIKATFYSLGIYMPGEFQGRQKWGGWGG